MYPCHQPIRLLQPWCYNLMQGYSVIHTIIIMLLLTIKWVHVHVCTLDSMYYCFADHHRLSSFQLVWLSSYLKIHQVSPRVQFSMSSSWFMPSVEFLRFTASTSVDHPLSENLFLFSSSLNNIIRNIMVTTPYHITSRLIRIRGRVITIFTGCTFNYCALYYFCWLGRLTWVALLLQIMVNALLLYFAWDQYSIICDNTLNGRIPYSGQLSREKTFMNFVTFQPPTKDVSAKYSLPTDPQKFSPSKVSVIR